MGVRPGADSVYRFELAGGAAGFAVHKTVGAEAHVELRLAVHAEFVAQAIRFSSLALGAEDPVWARSRRHGWSVVRLRRRRNVTEVTGKQVAGVRSQVSGKPNREMTGSEWRRGLALPET